MRVKAPIVMCILFVVADQEPAYQQGQDHQRKHVKQYGKQSGA